MDTNSSSNHSGDVPPKRFIKWGYSHIFSIVLPLVLINAGILHILGSQIAIKANAEVSQVKDASETLAALDNATSDNTEEVAIDEEEQMPVITTYVVKNGDSLSTIADKFDITINTIRWANNLNSKSAIKPGQELLILPVSGVKYTVKKGDTLSGIALKFDVAQDDILDYNDIKADAITVGIELVLPGAEPIAAPAPVKKSTPTKSTTTTQKTTSTASTGTTKFILPIADGVMTQNIHAVNAVDIGAPIGTKVFAAADGKVLATTCGRGYGTCLIINHADGSQTLYAHLSKITVATGDTVSQGDVIALSGNTGHSTGPHLHYEERGTHARNTVAKFKVGTHF